MKDDRLDGRHVIVTGGAQGIGRGIALRASKAGADITILDKEMGTAAETTERIGEIGGNASRFQVDLTDPDQIEQVVQQVIDEQGNIHGLVNNAGIQNSIPVVDTTVEEWNAHMNVNARGTFLCSKYVARHMIDRDIDGSIVNIASVGANRPFVGQGAYGASKAAIVALTIVLSKELGNENITANAINPGTVDTPMVQQWLDENSEQTGMSREELLRGALDEHTLDRMGRPEEIGNVVVLLLSDEGGWITGETINVDGGYSTQ